MSASSVAVFSAEMTCGGCSGACTRILNKIDGVKAVDASLETKTIRVDYDPALASPEVMLAALKKWGDNANKKVELVGA